MLIPFPFAFLSGAAAFDLAAAARGDERLAGTASHLRSAGIGMALMAAVPGVTDYFTTVPAGPPRQMASVHALSNVSALGLFAAAARSYRRDPGSPSAGTIVLELLGAALLGLGGSLVYHHHIGVTPEPSRAAMAEPAAPEVTERKPA